MRTGFQFGEKVLEVVGGGDCCTTIQMYSLNFFFFFCNGEAPYFPTVFNHYCSSVSGILVIIQS